MSETSIREARSLAVKELERLATIAEERTLTDDENTRVEELKANITDCDARLRLLDDAAEQRTRVHQDDERRNAIHAANASVEQHDEEERKRPAGSFSQTLRDPGHYRGTPDSHGWLSDQYRAHVKGDDEARTRLEAENAFGKQWRKTEGYKPEYRDLTHGTDTDGGALTPVKYLQEFHAQRRRAGGATLNICRRIDLPYGTDQISIPVMSSGVSTSIATENNAVSETDIVWGTNVTANVHYRSTLQDVSLQLLQQANPAVEEVVMVDMMRALVTAVDADVLNGTDPEGIFNADNTNTTTYTAGTATFQGLYGAIVNGVQEIWSNYYGAPSHIIMNPRRWAWMLGQVDGSNRVQLGFNPQNAAGAFSNTEAEGVVGQLLGIPVVIDSNVPTSGGAGTDEDSIAIVVGDELFLAMREPVLEVDFSAGFKNLQATVRGYLPHAFTAERFPSSISLITGTGLNDTL